MLGSRMVLAEREIGVVAHWCSYCVKLQRVALTGRYLEGRLFRVVSVGGSQLVGVVGKCLECSHSQPVAPERFPRGELAGHALDVDRLIIATNSRVVAQRERVATLRRVPGAAALCDALQKLLGSPGADELLTLAESETRAGRGASPTLVEEIQRKQASLVDSGKASELVLALAPSYPASAGLSLGVGAFAAPLALPWALAKSAAWTWGAALLAGAVLARTTIDFVRRRRVTRFVDETLKPALQQANLDAATFLQALRRHRLGTLERSAQLEDMASDHTLIAECLARG